MSAAATPFWRSGTVPRQVQAGGFVADDVHRHGQLRTGGARLGAFSEHHHALGARAWEAPGYSLDHQ